jgi:uncharacterized membrane protein YbhN (UPF0104 family)
MSPLVKKALHWVGSALAIVGIVFVTMRFYDYGAQLDISRFEDFTWFVVASFAFVYGLANTALALAWWNLLLYFGPITSRLWAIRVYGLTQLAKYVPGNVMHLASRQAIGLAAGVPGWPLAKASVWELGLISITGALFSILVLPQVLPAASASIAIVVFIGVLGMVAIVLKRYIGLPIARALGWYTIFLTTSGMVFVGLLLLFVNESSVTPSQVFLFCGAFVIAWLAGLVTPGAPAGIGVRELVLLFLLKGLVLESDLLLAVFLSRVVTIAGDVLFFLAALCLPSRESGSEQKIR